MQNTPCPITLPTSSEPCRSFYTTSCAPTTYPYDQHQHLPATLATSQHTRATTTSTIISQSTLSTTSKQTLSNTSQPTRALTHSFFLPPTRTITSQFNMAISFHTTRALGSFFLLKPSHLRWLWITTTTSVWESDFFIDLLWVLLHRFSCLLDLSQISSGDSHNECAVPFPVDKFIFFLIKLSILRKLDVSFTAQGPRTFDLRPKSLIEPLTRILAVTLKLTFIWWSDTLCIALFCCSCNPCN